MHLGDVVDQFHDDNRFADARAAKRANLAAFQERTNQINDLDAGRQNLRAGGLLGQRRRGAVNGIILLGLDRSAFIHRFANDVEHTAHDGLADGHGNRAAGVHDLVAALETFGGGHGDGAHPVVTEMLLHFERQPGLGAAGQDVFGSQRVINGGQRFGKFHIHDRADDLNDFAFVHKD